MRNTNPFVDLKPLMEALEHADREFGFDAWDLTKEWQLRMRGFADGVMKNVGPHWFDFIGSLGSDEPEMGVVPNQRDSRQSVGPGESNDQPRRTTLVYRLIDNTQFVTRPRLTSPDDVLYFHRPTQKQPSAGVIVPVRVGGIMVEMAELRQLIRAWKLSSGTADGAADGIAAPAPRGKMPPLQ